MEEVEAGRDWAGREGAGAGREGAERPPRFLYLFMLDLCARRGERERYRHVGDGLRCEGLGGSDGSALQVEGNRKTKAEVRKYTQKF